LNKKGSKLIKAKNKEKENIITNSKEAIIYFFKYGII
jgi:hypothetical protein